MVAVLFVVEDRYCCKSAKYDRVLSFVFLVCGRQNLITKSGKLCFPSTFPCFHSLTSFVKRTRNYKGQMFWDINMLKPNSKIKTIFELCLLNLFWKFRNTCSDAPQFSEKVYPLVILRQ